MQSKKRWPRTFVVYESSEDDCQEAGKFFEVWQTCAQRDVTGDCDYCLYCDCIRTDEATLFAWSESFEDAVLAYQQCDVLNQPLLFERDGHPKGAPAVEIPPARLKYAYRLGPDHVMHLYLLRAADAQQVHQPWESAYWAPLEMGEQPDPIAEPGWISWRQIPESEVAY